MSAVAVAPVNLSCVSLYSVVSASGGACSGLCMQKETVATAAVAGANEEKNNARPGAIDWRARMLLRPSSAPSTLTARYIDEKCGTTNDSKA